MKPIITIFTTLVFVSPLLASSASTDASTGSGDGGLLDAVVDQKTQDDIKGKVQEQTGSLLRGFLGIKEPKPPINETGPVEGDMYYAGDTKTASASRIPYYYTSRSAKPGNVAGICVVGPLVDEFKTPVNPGRAWKSYENAPVRVWVRMDSQGNPEMVKSLDVKQKEALQKDKCAGAFVGRAQLTKAVIVSEESEEAKSGDKPDAESAAKVEPKTSDAKTDASSAVKDSPAVATERASTADAKKTDVKDASSSDGAGVSPAGDTGEEKSGEASGSLSLAKEGAETKPMNPATASTSSEGKAVTSVQAPKQAAALSPVPVVSSKAAAAVKPGTREIDPRADDEDAVVEAVKAASPANPAIAMTGEAAEKPPAGKAPTNEHLVDTQFIARVFKHGGSVFGVITARGDFPAMKMANCVRFDKIIGKNGTPLTTEEITDGLQVTGYLIGDPSKPGDFILQPQESTDARIQKDAVASGKCKGTVYPGFSSFAGQDVNVGRATGR